MPTLQLKDGYFIYLEYEFSSDKIKESCIKEIEKVLRDYKNLDVVSSAKKKRTSKEKIRKALADNFLPLSVKKDVE